MSTTPHRIQRKRTKGWRMPAGAVYVGRPSRWGNPYRITDYRRSSKFEVLNSGRAVDSFERDLLAGMLDITIDDVRRELRGKDLCCWCPPGKPCHADVLLRVANEDA